VSWNLGTLNNLYPSITCTEYLKSWSLENISTLYSIISNVSIPVMGSEGSDDGPPVQMDPSPSSSNVGKESKEPRRQKQR
jgi:hypothetical protein